MTGLDSPIIRKINASVLDTYGPMAAGLREESLQTMRESATGMKKAALNAYIYLGEAQGDAVLSALRITGSNSRFDA